MKLYFAELDDVVPGDRVQTIKVQGKTMLTDFDIRSKSKTPMTGIVEVVPNVIVAGTLTITLNATRDTLISGIEVIRNP